MELLAKNKDIASVEVLPIHLTLHAPECYERLGTFAQQNPPVRETHHQDALWEAVRTLNKEIGTTVFLTTQYLEEADQLAQRIAIIDNGRIVREGTPTKLKSDVGAPTLRVDVVESDYEITKQVMRKLGEERPARKGRIAIGLDGGTRAITAVLKSLEEQNIEVQHVELDEPSLDDVFADATGRRLEGGADT